MNIFLIPYFFSIFKIKSEKLILKSTRLIPKSNHLIRNSISWSNQLDQLISLRLKRTLKEVEKCYKDNLDHHISTISRSTMTWFLLPISSSWKLTFVMNNKCNVWRRRSNRRMDSTWSCNKCDLVHTTICGHSKPQIRWNDFDYGRNLRHPERIISYYRCLW